MRGHLMNSRTSLQCTLYLSQRKTNKTVCALSKDSDQPGHSPSLIRVFAVRMQKAWVHLECIAKTDQTGWMPRLI